MSAKGSVANWPKRGVVIAAVGLVVAVVGAVIAAVGLTRHWTDGDASSPIDSSVAASVESSVRPTISAQPVVLAQGHRKIANVDGLDLDNGQVQEQDLPGVDLSPSKAADSIYAMTHGTPRFALLQSDGPTEHDRCAALPVDAWTKTVANVYALRLASQICVQTDQGNMAALTLTHIPSAAEQYLEFDFITWRDR
ncbi:hypothetical protein OIE68_30020 [Nocardia vinacea]|uniref:hypothetical protein n=1 Tax=Nocardia vinacea TaxID=96468 RepID=UPI002E11F45C|nr:hypothetical protein OIE68_30020 [Nocardia vinacea]